MRFAAVALTACLAGCSLTPPSSGSECHNDSQCGDDVCARSGECLARSSIHEVTVRWTVDGVTADATSCTTRVNSLSNLYIQFDGVDAGDTLRFAPVPCRQGSFFVDKLPKRYLQVELGFEGGTGDVLSIEATTSQLQFDLFQ
jgi:hypothetical protein